MSTYLEQLQLITLANTNYREVVAHENDRRDEDLWRNTIVQTVAIPDMDHIQLRNHQFRSLTDTESTKSCEGRSSSKCAICPDGSVSEGFRRQVARQVRGSQRCSNSNRGISEGTTRGHRRRQKRDRAGKNRLEINDGRGKGDIYFERTTSTEKGDDNSPGGVLNAIKQLEDFLRCE
mmetsp:Transcript_6663/g.9856  ORF Transcript_6663/g.9856 Transcript_6663/m.9856 type:complete len:177 (+) Transcript_6663:1361-1891(+)